MVLQVLFEAVQLQRSTVTKTQQIHSFGVE